MKKYVFPLVVLIAWSFAGCDKPEPIPTYLRIEPFVVNEKGGAEWQRITDGWLYVNTEFLGAYTLPAMIPILAEGNQKVTVFPGVKENGILVTPNIYPFLKRYEATVEFSPNDEPTISPSTAYDPTVVQPWGDGGEFDGNTIVQFENRDGDGATGFELTTNGAFFGKSLRMEVDTAHPTIDIASQWVPLPTTAAQEVWMELHHNNDIPFALYLLSGPTEFAQPVYRFNRTEGWNKIYINLTEYLIVSLQEEHRLFFRVTLPKDEFGRYTQLKGKVMFDNIRLLHY